ncbi:conserved hypothetical protein [Photorhabdus asymbiotica]|uniref:WblL protein n=3 Tax=Morganellaceae TaxID=1903414 RepID=B6VM05_PHOAA|nr:hypothetical protein BDD30_2382 [Photorhabdus asymbiotica]CAQ86404.1 conserved hypothetical protein [Photorhabdus asymbiotica]CAR67185.1 Conserved Hypothetical Protein [Photorhabdus asymbiotica subsp. asymbiotica ATCC 43949]
MQNKIKITLKIFLYQVIIYLNSVLILDTFHEVRGYNITPQGYLSIFLCWISFLPLILLNNKKNPVMVFLWLIYITYIIPVSIIFPLINSASLNSTIFILTINILFFLSILFFRIIDRITMPKLKIPWDLYKIIIIGCGIIVLLFVISNPGFSLIPPNIFRVYAVREHFKENTPLLTMYIITNGGYVISPLLLLASLYVRGSIKYILITISIAISYLIYSSSGLKSIAFMNLAVIILFFYIKGTRSISNSVINIILYLFLTAGILYFIFDFYDPLIHWLRRVFFTPTLNTYYFYDYIYNNNSEFTKEAPQIISQIYYGTSGSANTGFIGDGIARYGTFGLLINFFIFNILIFAMNLSSKKVPFEFSTTLYLPFVYTISNSAITALLLTYGLLALSILLFLFPTKTNKIPL